MAIAKATLLTAPSHPSARIRRLRSAPPRRPLWLKLLVLALIALTAAMAFYWSTIRGYAQTGASYGARVACSCRFIGGRPLDDCRKDFEPGMELVYLTEDSQARSVTARFPLLARHTATYHEGWGCVLEKWEK